MDASYLTYTQTNRDADFYPYFRQSNYTVQALPLLNKSTLYALRFHGHRYCTCFICWRHTQYSARVISTAIIKNHNAITLGNLIAQSIYSSRWITYLNPKSISILMVLNEPPLRQPSLQLMQLVTSHSSIKKKNQIESQQYILPAIYTNTTTSIVGRVVYWV